MYPVVSLPRWSGIVVNLRRATMSGFNSRCRTLISVCNQPATQCQVSLPSPGVDKWAPASSGKAKAGMGHSVSGGNWDRLKTSAIHERRRGLFTTIRYTNPRFPYFTLPTSPNQHFNSATITNSTTNSYHSCLICSPRGGSCMECRRGLAMRILSVRLTNARIVTKLWRKICQDFYNKLKTI